MAKTRKKGEKREKRSDFDHRNPYLGDGSLLCFNSWDHPSSLVGAPPAAAGGVQYPLGGVLLGGF